MVLRAQVLSLVLLVPAAHADAAGKMSADTISSDSVKVLEPMVVTALRAETPLREVASTMSIIDSGSVQWKTEPMVQELLRGMPGLDIVESGGMGRESHAFIRGAKSEHTLVLIDGVEMNDPVSPGRTSSLAGLSTDNIERIEVLRGPQSTLYGSDAMGGVINLITRRGYGKPSVSLSLDGGSFMTFNEAASVCGQAGWFDYSVGASRLDTKGFSAADDSAAAAKYGNAEDDGFENSVVSARIGAVPVENLRIEILSRYIRSKTDIDNWGGVGGDDPNSTSDLSRFSLRCAANLALFKGLWNQKFGMSLTNHERDDRNDEDDLHPGEIMQSLYNGQLRKLEWQNTFHVHRANSIVAGVEGEEEIGESGYNFKSSRGEFSSSLKDKRFRNAAVYIEDHLGFRDCLFTTIGARYDFNSKFTSSATYRAGLIYHLPFLKTRVHATLGTGFKAPSIFQVYSEYGDKGLEPEQSTGWDAGIEQPIWNERIIFGITGFGNKFDNLIEFNSNMGVAGRYENIDSAESRGVEVFSSFRPFDQLQIDGAYTYTDAINSLTGEELLLRPRHKVRGELNYRIFERATIGMVGTYIGKRYDFPRIKMDSYKLFNVFLSYNVTKKFTVYSKFDNVFDEKYEEISGYGTAGLSVSAGIKLSIPW